MISDVEENVGGYDPAGRWILASARGKENGKTGKKQVSKNDSSEINGDTMMTWKMKVSCVQEFQKREQYAGVNKRY